MLKQKYFLAGIFILSAEKQPIKLSWRKIEWLPDMRKSFYSLSGIVTNLMGMNVQDGDAYIFINKSLTGLKILHAEYGGLMHYTGIAVTFNVSRLT